MLVTNYNLHLHCASASPKGQVLARRHIRMFLLKVNARFAPNLYYKPAVCEQLLK